MRKRLMIYLFILVGAWVLLAVWVRWNEPRMVYYPERSIEVTPQQLGLRYDDVTLVTKDNVRINGWFIPAVTSKGVILFFHGNAGNISHRFEKIGVFHDLGMDVFIIDYRGYGRSEGQPNEPGTYRDADAAYEYLTRQRGTAPSQIVVYGESLGSAVAIDLASRLPAGGLVIEEAFTSIVDVGRKMFPYLPVRLMVRNKYDSLAKIGRIHTPLLIFHSRDDEFFPMRHAERLLAAAPEPKQLVQLRGGHNDAFLVSAETYRQALQKFLAGAPVPPSL